MTAYFVQLNELLDTILECSGRMGPAFPAGGPSGKDSEASFSDVEKAVGDLRNIWINIDLVDCSCPMVNTVMEKMKQFIKVIRDTYVVPMREDPDDEELAKQMRYAYARFSLIDMMFNCTYINIGSN